MTRLVDWEVTLSRKPTVNASQNARKRLEYVRAETADAAKQTALSLPQNAAFRVSSVREVR